MICWKCKGSGILSQFKHVDNGKCYPCNGTGRLTYDSHKEWNYELLEKVSKDEKVKDMLNVDVVALESYDRELLRTYLLEKGEIYGVEFDTKDLMQMQGQLKQAFEKRHGVIKEPVFISREPVDERALERDGIKQAEDGNFYNKEGIRIVNLSASSLTNTQFASGLGNSKLPKIPMESVEFFAETKDPYELAEIKDVFDNAVSMVNERFGNLVANVAVVDFIAKSTKPSIGGTFSNNKIYLNVKHVEKNLSKLRSKLSHADYTEKKKKNGYAGVAKTIVHELSHAFHAQHLSRTDMGAYQSHGHYTGLPSDKIVEMYNEKLQRVVKKSGRREMEVRQAFYEERDNYGKEGSIFEFIEEEFPSIYASVNPLELFAVSSDRIASKKGREQVKKDFPEVYEMLKNLYEGVIDL